MRHHHWIITCACAAFVAAGFASWPAGAKGQPAAATVEFDRVLRVGDRGDQVKALQERLNQHGYSLEIDGLYGRSTGEAVRDFQRKNKLTADGNFGPKTAELLQPKSETKSDAAPAAAQVAAAPAAAQEKPAADKAAAAKPKKAPKRCRDGEPAEVASYEVSKGKNLPASIDKPLTTEAGDADRGLGWMAHRRLGNCIACHQISKVEKMAETKPDIEVTDLNGKKSKMPLGTHGYIGPGLDGVADRYTEGELRMLVVDPKKNFPDTIMPAFHKNAGFLDVFPDCKGLAILSAGQVEDVVAFLKTLKE